MCPGECWLAGLGGGATGDAKALRLGLGSVTPRHTLAICTAYVSVMHRACGARGQAAGFDLGSTPGWTRYSAERLEQSWCGRKRSTLVSSC